ncbi:benzoate-CoA ligase family protein [Streptomyces alanosinicus]|uniref:Benzoate--CoA ligase n=1 Tax=Streptomyces alanosinicus TaxID=68171 RepID=A0A918YRG4_9ACTN|nr:benzoate-CoA ligase family protein [Streptomyces alanosinicus]GHE12683.1 benzoate--CoA ligase [Streptomyces alanosinicus]
MGSAADAVDDTDAVGSVERNAGWWYLDRHLSGAGADALCLLCGDEQLTYRQLHALVCRVARVFTAAGIAPGQRIALALHDTPDFVAYVLAALRVGAVPVPVAPLLTVAEQRYVVADCGASAVVVEDGAGPLAAELAGGPDGVPLWCRRPGPGAVRCLPEEARRAAPLTGVVPRADEDVAVLQYTSGSTGRPKGVVHLHRGLLAFPEGIVRHLGVTRHDRVLSTAKLPFGYGFGNSLLLPLSVGASAVLLPGRAEPHAVAALLRRARPTLLFAVPTLYAALLALPRAEQSLDFSGVRLAVAAGEPLGARLCTALADRFGLAVVNGLGATECLHIVTATLPGRVRPGSVGESVPGFEAEVCDEAGRPLPDGSPGRLRVRGPSVADRYWGRPELTARTFRDGWVHTGDTMVRDADAGWVHLGRSDDVLNVGGMKIAPTEVEDAIAAVDGVEACAVVGVQDADGLTRIAAQVVPRAGCAEGLAERIRAALRHSLPVFKRPRTLRLVDALPTTTTGKTARHAVRRQEQEPVS